MPLTVLSFTYQLTWFIEETFNNQLRLFGISAFQYDVQVFAHSLNGDVFRCNAILTFSQNIFGTFNRLDFNRLPHLLSAQRFGFDNGVVINHCSVNLYETHIDPLNQ